MNVKKKKKKFMKLFDEYLMNIRSLKLRVKLETFFQEQVRNSEYLCVYISQG